MIKKVHVFILLLLLTAFGASGQVIRTFTPDSLVFINELTILVDNIAVKDNREKTAATLQQFSEYWLGERFNHVEKLQIYELSNLMLSKRLRIYPDFDKVLRVLMHFKSTFNNDEQFGVWLQGATRTLKESRSTKYFNTLLEATLLLFDKEMLYESHIFSWAVDGGKFQFHNDSLFRISFANINLHCNGKNDSTTIYNTSGNYYPVNNSWTGFDGKVTWKRAGFSEDSIYAMLDNYNIEFKTSSFTADSVNFYNLNYFPGPIPGNLEEKVKSESQDKKKALYPYFRSFTTSLFIPELFKDVDYQGGFSLKGAKIIGEGDEYLKASLTFKRPYRDKQGKYDLLIAKSDAFVIEPDQINSSNAAIFIYHQGDSIFHTGLQFKYMHDKREVSLLRIERGVMESPYSDTYHNVEIDCEAVYWKMDESEIRFRSLIGVQRESEALFISDKYFKNQEFDYLQGMDDINPLLQIYNFAKQDQRRTFHVYELAEYLRMPLYQVELQVIRLAKYGFLYYGNDGDRVRIGDKLYHYIEAKRGARDYDVISFYSQVYNQDNATLSLDNFDLLIRGVPRVSISDSQNVYIYPTNEEVILRKNRDFLFSGKVQAGLFEFTAKDCMFDYDTFRLDLPTIEFMRFKVKAFDSEPGEKRYVDVRTVVSNISGNLLIDNPDNKSGLVNYPDYPVFNSLAESFVYYDQQEEFKDAYSRERFYYNLQPFTLKRLVDFSTDSLIFKGYLNSGGIFRPEVNKPLTVMPDYSLGFQVKSPPEGFPVYNNKGVFHNKVSLSMAGLRGTGTVEYLNTTAKGTDVMFYLDSVNGLMDEFSIQEQKAPKAEFPSMTGVHIFQNWRPYQDTMFLSSTDVPMKIFGETVQLNGSLIYTPELLTGAGKQRFYRATTRANHYVYGNNYFDADTLNLDIADTTGSQVAFIANRYNAHVDFNQNTASFYTTGKNSGIDFPLAKYVTAMDEFEWDIDKNTIHLVSHQVNPNVEISALTQRELINKIPDGTKLISTHPLQDSLSFYSTRLNYNLASNILLSEGVKIIKVADAAIFPGDGVVEITAESKMLPLRNAIIIADTINKIHQIIEADVNIQSRYAYRAKGLYEYVNLLGEVQIVEFDDIKVDTSYQTIANGNVTPEHNFMFSPQFAFRGKVFLNARNPLLDFEGGYKLIQDCDPELSRWVEFHQRIVPDSIVLPVESEPNEFNYKKLYAGFFHSNEENRVYPALLSRRAYYSDTLMLSVNGAITTRKNGNEFIIASESDLRTIEKHDPTGSYISLNTNDCYYQALGALNFGTDYGRVSMESFGQIEHYVIPDSTLFHVFMAFNFLFSDDALGFMKESFRLENKKGVNPSSPVSDFAYLQMLGQEDASDVIYNLNTFGNIRKLPEGLKKTLILSDVTLEYNPQLRSFISSGPIGVGFIQGEAINKYFEGHMEIKRKRSGDVMNLYIEIDKKHWYFFTYFNNVMSSYSSKTEYNQLITEVESNKRKDKESKDQREYRYGPSTSQAKNRFLRSLRTLEPEED